jgi:hypothetical protein
MVRSWIGIVALALGSACTSFVSPEITDSETGPADYQQLVARDLAAMKDRVGMGPLEISPLRRTRLAQPGDWMACVRTTVQERPTYLAVFMREGRVLDRRVAVVIDECGQEQFQPISEHRPASPTDVTASTPNTKSAPKSSPK